MKLSSETETEPDALWNPRNRERGYPEEWRTEWQLNKWRRRGGGGGGHGPRLQQGQRRNEVSLLFLSLHRWSKIKTKLLQKLRSSQVQRLSCGCVLICGGRPCAGACWESGDPLSPCSQDISKEEAELQQQPLALTHWEELEASLQQGSGRRSSLGPKASRFRLCGGRVDEVSNMWRHGLPPAALQAPPLAWVFLLVWRSRTDNLLLLHRRNVSYTTRLDNIHKVWHKESAAVTTWQLPKVKPDSPDCPLVADCSVSYVKTTSSCLRSRPRSHLHRLTSNPTVM